MIKHSFAAFFRIRPAVALLAAAMFAGTTFIGAMFIGATIVSGPALAQSDDKLKARYDNSMQGGNYAEAERIAKRIQAATARRYGKSHFNYGVALNDLGRVYDRQGRFQQAIPIFEQALVIFERKVGRSHKSVAVVLNNLANVQQKQNLLAQASANFKRALIIYEKVLGRDHRSYTETQQNLGGVYEAQGRYAEAAAIYEDAIKAHTKNRGPNDLNVASGHDHLANALSAQSQYAQALSHYEKALNIYIDKLGRDHPNVANTFNNMANVQNAQGNYTNAVDLYTKALEIYNVKLAPDHPYVANTLGNLGNSYHGLGRNAEAIPVYQRAIAIKEKALGPNHPSLADSRNNLASLFVSEKRYAEAEPLLQSALADYKKGLGPTHPRVAVALDNLGLVSFGQGQFAQSAEFHEQARDIRVKVYGEVHPEVATTINNLANAYLGLERYSDAIPLYKRAINIDERTFGNEHPKIAREFDSLAHANFKLGRYDQALSMSRRASLVLTRSYRRATAGDANEAGNNKSTRHIYERHVQMAYEVALGNSSAVSKLGDEALAAAQRYNTTAISAALSQMAARFGTGDQALAQLVRKQQDLTSQRQKIDKAVIQALSAPADKRDTQAIAQLVEARTKVEKQQDQIANQLNERFPQYRELTDPEPLPIAEVRRLLGPDEALVFYLVADSEVFVWAITKNDFRWTTLGKTLNAETLAARVAEFRKGLTIEAAGGAESDRFNLEAAHKLYQDILAPVEDMVRDKKNLIIMPTGALTSLPFNVLVTDEPDAPVPSTGAGYRDAAWLIKRHAITILPSISSLKALRVLASKGRASDAFIGFGDPVFGDSPSGSSRGKKAQGETLSFRSYFKGTRANREALIAALPPLPGTSVELKAVAKSLGVPDSELRLGKAANEAAVKELKLDQYRIVYFATHGLVAGETKLVANFAEPSLALTIPTTVSDKDDGLLTGSEIAQLKLNADWVVLSACNTAAGDKPGAEALSGLAKAFTYAGARALLVSHWPVGDEAAARLTSGAFARLKDESDIGRAEALRLSMLAMIADDSKPTNAYPAFWAPFFIVGDGGR